MATFTAATFIPQMQPYQPDLNLYANLLQNKQSQYDSNWKSLNQMYGQYFYADLTRDDNTKKKDYLVDQINFNVGRIAGLDLSLQQNVSQATQIFKPFYEDQGLMKDMAWTKNYNSQVGKYQALQGSSDEKDRAQAWDTGMREMQYKKDEFKEITADKAMGFQNVLYTPYVNVQNKALELAKDYGDIQTVTWSPDNRWIIKKTNGQALEEPLNKLFEASLGSDPQIQAIYKTQSYVNRKDYAYSNAAQFGNDKNAAEMKYLENNFIILKKESNNRYKSIQERSTIYDNKIKELQTQITNKTGTQDTQKMLDAYIESKSINDAVLARVKKDNDILNSGESSTTTTSTGFKNPYGDIESLRYKVDNGVASMLLDKDLDEAAHTFAYRHYKEDPQANPYAVMQDKHNYTMSEIDARLKGQQKLELLKDKLARNRDDDNRKLDSGAYYKNENGEIVPAEDQNVVTTETDSEGVLSTDAVNLRNESKKISKMTNNTYLSPYLNTSISMLNKAKNDGTIDEATMRNILTANNGVKLSLKDFTSNYSKYGDGWLRKNYGLEGIERIQTKLDSWVNKNQGLFNAGNGKKTQEYINYTNSKQKLGEYYLYLKTDEKFRYDNSIAVMKSLEKDGYKGASKLYDKGELRTEKEYYASFDQKFLQSQAKSFKKRVFKDKFDYFPQPDLQIKEGTLYYGSDIDYKSVLNAAQKKWTNPNIVKGSPARLALGPVNPGTGLFTVGSSKITVNPKANNIGVAHYNEQMRVLQGLDFGDGKSVLTFNGKSGTSYSDAKDVAGRNTVATSILNSLSVDFNRARQKGSTSKLENFSITLAPMSAGNQNLTAVTIRPNSAWLAEYNKGETDNKILTPEEYKSALTNGFTFISDSKNFDQTGLYQGSYKSPLATYIDSFGSYTESSIDGDQNKNIIFEKNNLGIGGDYITRLTYPSYDPLTKTTTKVNFEDNTTGFGDNLQQQLSNFHNYLNGIDEQNADLFNNY